MVTISPAERCKEHAHRRLDSDPEVARCAASWLARSVELGVGELASASTTATRSGWAAGRGGDEVVDARPGRIGADGRAWAGSASLDRLRGGVGENASTRKSRSV